MNSAIRYIVAAPFLILGLALVCLGTLLLTAAYKIAPLLAYDDGDDCKEYRS